MSWTMMAVSISASLRTGAMIGSTLSVQVGIEHESSPLEAGRDLREQLKPLASQRGFKGAEAGDVP